MAFLQVKQESVETEATSDYITKSGIYDITLKHVEVVNTQNGAVQVNYFFDKAMSYGNTILGTNGQPTFGYKILEALAATLGEEVLSDPEPTTVQFKKGSKELSCIPELNDVKVKVWIQFKYEMYNDNITERVVVKRFYRESDGASGSEVLTGKDIGARLSKDMEFANEIKYEDGVTPEAVEAWKKAKATANATSPAPKISGFPGAKKSPFPGV